MATNKLRTPFGMSLCWSVAFVFCPILAHAGGGRVLSPGARPHRYSLSDMAAATALFNSGPRVPGTEPETPFQILYVPSDGNTEFTVPAGTFFYVPLVWSDNTEPILGDFPEDVTDLDAVLEYYQSPEQFGAQLMEIEVDGNVTSLVKRGYPVGVVAPTSIGGTEYTVVAAFLSPMSKGTHTVTIRGFFQGDALEPFGGVFAFELTYTVHVV